MFKFPKTLPRGNYRREIVIEKTREELHYIRAKYKSTKIKNLNHRDTEEGNNTAYKFMIVLYKIFILIKINIDIGTKILKQKCFGRKTYFLGTFFNFSPAKAKKSTDRALFEFNTPEAVGPLF